MNDANDTRNGTVWAYVHDALAPEARQRFETELQGDPALQREVQAVRTLDRHLREGLRAPAKSEAELAAEGVAAWERDPASANIDAARPAHARRLRVGLFATPFRSALTGLAAAAALLLAICPRESPSALDWRSARFAPPAFRGGSGTPPAPVCSQATANRCLRLLRLAVEAEMTAQGLAPQPGLVLRFRLQEFAGGQFGIALQAFNRDGTLAREWTGDYANEAEFRAHVAESARVVAEALARPD